jgi:hypothetical protein
MKGGKRTKGEQAVARVHTSCLYCGADIYSTPYRISIGAGKYCCKEHHHKSMVGKVPYNKGVPNPAWFKSSNPKWKGGKKTSRGYVYIWVGHNYIAEHRLIMEQKLGRSLNKKEEIHHINYIKNDNRIDNLELFKDHSSHVKTYHIDNGYKTRFKKKVRVAI